MQIPDGLGADKTARVMACPQFTVPLAMDLRYTHPDWLLPGLGNFPDNSVTLLEADGAFVESFLAGAKSRDESGIPVGRAYPTDQRGTPFRYFSAATRPRLRYPSHHKLVPQHSAGPKRNEEPQDLENMVFLLVRGELLHRYLPIDRSCS